jgi:endonuclease G
LIIIFSHSLVAISEPSSIEDEVFFAGVPKDISVPGTIEVLDNDSFVVGFSEERGTPAWVAYRVSQVNHFENLKRPSRFKTDSRVSEPVKHSDYTHSGYDRGHMAPNFAIATRHPEDMEDTYLMTNIIPQSPNLNRGPWLDLEMNVAKRYAQYRD